MDILFFMHLLVWETSKRTLRNIKPIDYNENLNKTNLSESDHEEKVISTDVNGGIWINIKRCLCNFNRRSIKENGMNLIMIMM